MNITLRDSRALIATIRHDCKAGNIERARKWAGEFMVGDWTQATPAQLEQACTAIESKLDEAGL